MFGSSNRIIIQTQTSKTTQKWVTEHKTKLLLLFQSSDLNPVEDEWTEEKKHRHGSVNLKDLEWFWMKEWSLISCQVFSDLNPVEHEWTEEKKHRHGSVNLKDLEWFWMKEWSLISCQVFSDLNPVEHEWTEEAPSWICESEGSGVILDEGMVSDLLSGVLWPHQVL